MNSFSLNSDCYILPIVKVDEFVWFPHTHRKPVVTCHVAEGLVSDAHIHLLYKT